MQTTSDIIRALENQRTRIEQLASRTNDLAQLLTQVQEQQNTTADHVRTLAQELLNVQTALLNQIQGQQPPSTR